MQLEDLDTPALVVDLDVMARNIRRMSDFAKECGVVLRPHVKTHKSPEIARMQLAAGSTGVCLQKVSEVEVFAQNGFDDIFLTNEVVVPAKIERLARVAEKARVGLAVDDMAVPGMVGKIFKERGEEVEVYVDVDNGMKRSGVHPGGAGALAKEVSRHEGLVFKGIMGYEGNVASGETRKEQVALSKRAMEIVGEAKRGIEAEGLAVEVVSVGSSVSTWINAKDPLTTEVQPGMYVFNDHNLVRCGVANWDDCALKVISTVMSKPAEDRALVDGGSKCFNFDLGLFPITLSPGVKMTKFSEEHGWLELSDEGRKLRVGDRLEFIPAHCCTTANQHEQIYGIRRRSVERVFRVAARGKMG